VTAIDLSTIKEVQAPKKAASNLAKRFATYVSRRPEWTLTPAIVIAFLATWVFVTHVLSVPEFVLPRPEAVWFALVDGLSHSPTDAGGYWYHCAITIYESLAGLVLGSLFGALIGFGLGASQLLERTFYPFIIAFQALPKVALAPLLVIWFGLGYDGKIYITAIITFFPVLVSAIAGSHSVDPDRLDLARSCNASPSQILRKIVIPSALPFLFAGLNVASALAVLGAIVGEFVGARAGLGMLLIQYDQAMQIAPLFAILILLGVIGFAINWAVRVAERRYCFWAQRRRHSVSTRL
jgi:NitT/TauT family transport system permease protein